MPSEGAPETNLIVILTPVPPRVDGTLTVNRSSSARSLGIISKSVNVAASVPWLPKLKSVSVSEAPAGAVCMPNKEEVIKLV